MEYSAEISTSLARESEHATAFTTEKTGIQLAVMSFNMRREGLDRNDNEWTYRKDGVVEIIRRADPIIVGTQEANSAMLNYLARELPVYDWIGVNRSNAAGDEFSGAILYRTYILQVVAAGQFWLSETPNIPGSRFPGTIHPRLANWARFRVRACNAEFVFCSTHLDHSSQAAREFGASMIREHIAEQRKCLGLSVILAGDMNAEPTNSAIRKLQFAEDGTELLHDAADWLRSRGEDMGTTFHGFKGGARGLPIDYIFYTEGLEVGSFSRITDQVNGRYPSDHYPIVAKFILKGATCSGAL